ncbi:uncharacterized protein [Palaemon carinicauda]|uniref:uncharacterized protein n=1 Tax=Palaemon carinicauda TaxID=392227 RepID=UPI0035B67317
MPKQRKSRSQKCRAKTEAGNVAACTPVKVTTESSPTSDPNPRYGKDLCQEQRDSSYKKQKDSSSKEQEDSSSQAQKDSSSKKQKDSSSEKQKNSSSKEPENFSSEEKQNSSSEEQENSSSKEPENSSSKEPKNFSSEEQENSSSKELENFSSEEQENFSSKEQENFSYREQENSSSEEQETFSYKEQELSSSKEQEIFSSQEQELSSSKEQEIFSSQEQELSSSEKQELFSSQEQELSSSQEQELSSSELQELSSSEKQELFSSQEQELSSSQEQELSSSELQELFPSQEQELSSSQEQTNSCEIESAITNLCVIGDSTLTELREYSERSWESIVEVRHWLEKPDKPAAEKDPSKRGEHVINNGVLKIYRDVVEEFVAYAFGTNLRHLENNVLLEDSSVLRAIREPVPCDVMYQISDVMVVHLQRSYMDSNAKAFGEKLDIVKGVCFGYMRSLYKPSYFSSLNGMERNIVALVEDFIRGGFFIDDDALAIWCKRRNSIQVFEQARNKVESMLRRLIPHRGNNPLSDWVCDLCKRHVISVRIHNISRDVVEEFVRNVLEGNLKLSDLENKTLSKNSSVLRAIRELDCPKVMHLLRLELAVDIRYADSYQDYSVAGKIQQIKKVFVTHMKSIYGKYVPPSQTDIVLVEDFIANEEYVDKDALKIWLGNGKNANTYKEVSGRVGSVLRRMIPCGRNNLLAIWVNELYNAAERLLEQRR